VTRLVVTAVAIVALVGFAFLTLDAALRDGVTVGTVVSLFVLAVMGIGILGALSQRPPEE
jgi:hypothetical protein